MPPEPITNGVANAIQQAQAQRQWDVLKQQRDQANDQIVVLHGVIASLEAQLAQARAAVPPATADATPELGP